MYAHGNDILRAARNPRRNARQRVPFANRVIANSRYSAGMLRRMGVPDESIAVVHPGCSVEELHPSVPSKEVVARVFGDSPPGPVLLTVGGLVARKGQDVVLRALPGLLHRYRNLRHSMVGYGPQRDILERRAVELGVARHVVFAGKAERRRREL